MTDEKTDRRKDRKERVLHTRVPEVLADELKELAERMRVPVSNVVRSFLEDAVDAMSAMGHRAEGEIRDWADRLGEPGRSSPPRLPEPEEPPPPTAAPLAGVIGFQPLTLAQPTRCGLSGRELLAGEEAYLGLKSDGSPPLIVAPECVPRSSGETDGT
ncbi:MAG: hypothetical protein CL910_12640 [Deltaproteobacteria bacterium]|jgi:hypothetical protein|nr:hypothetical protein [Deltaproteobacteria bacterium]